MAPVDFYTFAHLSRPLPLWPALSASAPRPPLARNANWVRYQQPSWQPVYPYPMRSRYLCCPASPGFGVCLPLAVAAVVLADVGRFSARSIFNNAANCHICPNANGLAVSQMAAPRLIWVFQLFAAISFSKFPTISQ